MRRSVSVTFILFTGVCSLPPPVLAQLSAPVLEIMLSPGAREPVHDHTMPGVIFGEGGGGSALRFFNGAYRWADGDFVITQRRELEPAAGGLAVWTGPAGAHALTSIGPAGVTFTRVEMKPESCVSER
jgi:hypothetical protein